LLISSCLLLLSSCQNAQEIKKEQYLVNGERLYIEHCANCHGNTAQGFKALNPPLSGLSQRTDSHQYLYCVIKNGLDQAIEVEGKVFDQPMPKIAGLYDLDIAQLSTYIHVKFLKKDTLFEAKNMDCPN
jgi:mono/diheme cytochrome c family protein